MTQKEFEERVNGKVTPEDYQLIEILYYASRDIDKDRFCEDFKSILAYDSDQVMIHESLVRIAQQIQLIDEENNEMRSTLYQRNGDLVDFLIGKAHAYEDTDFRKQAMKLVGEAEVVKRTIELGLPLWDEDRKVILSIIEEHGE